MAISDPQLLLLTSACVLLSTRSRSELSEFESETIVEVALRFHRFRREAIVSDPEWQVIEDAVSAMRKALGRRLGEYRAGALVGAA